MKIKTIKKSVDIKAPREKVWKVLFDNNLNREWYREFSEGAQAGTDWKEGSKATFTDSSGMGMLGYIKQNKPNESLTIEYNGYIGGGKEDTESESAKAINGTQERYQLTEKDGITHLDISCEMEEKYFDSLNEAWDRALQKIKTMAEK